MRFTLLGSLSAADDAGPITLRGAQRRTLLAMLLLRAGEPVSSDALAHLLWGEDAARHSGAPLHNQIARLRQALGDNDRVRAAPPGYLVQVEPGELDIHVFAEEFAAGRQQSAERAWAEASRRFGAALALWSGRPLADIPALADDARVRELEEMHVQALQGRIEADLNLGRHHELTDELSDLIREHRQNETFHRQLMLALHRAGRTEEATAVYDAYERALLDELGLEPSAELRELRDAVEREDPALALPPNPDAPRQLPADTRLFTGRAAELTELVAAAGQSARTLVISALDGLGGIGKTALAVHAAHRVAGRFPDGQLFVDLRGHTAADAMPVDEALAYLLRALGVPASAVPDAVAERAAQYRSRLENSRTLIVLDNAADVEQVRPLLPGAPGCLVLITSRNRLALDDARSLTLDSLGEDDAVALLRKVAGPERELGDLDQIRSLARLCGCVPLALRIVAARLRHDAALTVATLIAELRDERGRLAQLSDDERDLTSVFDSAFANLPDPERELLRLLGLLPGPDLDAYAAANLAGTDLRTAEGLLESLLSRNLLIQQKTGRYVLHDLVRAYARTLIDPDGEPGRSAKDRLLGFYLHTAWTADRLLARVTEPRTDPPGEASGPLPDLADRDDPLSWLRLERPNLLAAATSPAVDPAQRVHLTGSLAELLYQDGPYPQATVLHQTAAREAGRLGDRLAEANALLAFGRANAFCTAQDISATVSALDEALSIFRALPNRQGEANARYALGGAFYNLSRNKEATTHLRAALSIYEDLGEKLGMAHTYRYLIRCLEMQGDSRMSLHYCHEALALCRAEGDRHGEALALSSLGRCEVESGHLSDADEHLNQALAIMRERGYRRNEAGILLILGRVHEYTGDFDSANATLGEALEIFQSVGYTLAIASTQVYLGKVAKAAGDYPAAIELFERSLEGFATTDHRSSIASIKRELGMAVYLSGDPRGVPLIEESLRLITEWDLGVYGHSETVAALAEVAEAEGDTRRALALYREALPLARQMIAAPVEAGILNGLARCHALLGEPDEAREALLQAVAIYRRMGARELAEAEERLAALGG